MTRVGLCLGALFWTLPCGCSALPGEAEGVLERALKEAEGAPANRVGIADFKNHIVSLQRRWEDAIMLSPEGLSWPSNDLQMLLQCYFGERTEFVPKTPEGIVRAPFALDRLGGLEETGKMATGGLNYRIAWFDAINQVGADKVALADGHLRCLTLAAVFSKDLANEEMFKHLTRSQLLKWAAAVASLSAQAGVSRDHRSGAWSDKSMESVNSGILSSLENARRSLLGKLWNSRTELIRPEMVRLTNAIREFGAQLSVELPKDPSGKAFEFLSSVDLIASEYSQKLLADGDRKSNGTTDVSADKTMVRAILSGLSQGDGVVEWRSRGSNFGADYSVMLNTLRGNIDILNQYGEKTGDFSLLRKAVESCEDFGRQSLNKLK